MKRRSVKKNNKTPKRLKTKTARNGNIDVSPVFGFFLVITYITDYNYKTEPEDKLLREALKRCEGEDLKTKMKATAHTFLTAKQMVEPLAI